MKGDKNFTKKQKRKFDASHYEGGEGNIHSVPFCVPKLKKRVSFGDLDIPIEFGDNSQRRKEPNGEDFLALASGVNEETSVDKEKKIKKTSKRSISKTGNKSYRLFVKNIRSKYCQCYF